MIDMGDKVTFTGIARYYAFTIGTVSLAPRSSTRSEGVDIVCFAYMSNNGLI